MMGRYWALDYFIVFKPTASIAASLPPPQCFSSFATTPLSLALVELHYSQLIRPLEDGWSVYYHSVSPALPRHQLQPARLTYCSFPLPSVAVPAGHFDLHSCNCQLMDSGYLVCWCVWVVGIRLPVEGRCVMHRRVVSECHWEMSTVRHCSFLSLISLRTTIPVIEASQSIPFTPVPSLADDNNLYGCMAGNSLLTRGRYTEPRVRKRLLSPTLPLRVPASFPHRRR